MTIKTLGVGAALALLVGTTNNALVAQASVPATEAGVQAAPPAQARPGNPQRPADRKPWWNDEAIRKELGLTDDQTKALDQIYTSAKDELAGYWDARAREEKELDRLIAESKVEQWVIARQIDKVETQRSNWNKLRIMTLYRMHRLLTPEQRAKLEQIRNRDHKDPRARP